MTSIVLWSLLNKLREIWAMWKIKISYFFLIFLEICNKIDHSGRLDALKCPLKHIFSKTYTNPLHGQECDCLRRKAALTWSFFRIIFGLFMISRVNETWKSYNNLAFSDTKINSKVRSVLNWPKSQDWVIMKVFGHLDDLRLAIDRWLFKIIIDLWKPWTWMELTDNVNLTLNYTNFGLMTLWQANIHFSS